MQCYGVQSIKKLKIYFFLQFLKKHYNGIKILLFNFCFITMQSRFHCDVKKKTTMEFRSHCVKGVPKKNITIKSWFYYYNSGDKKIYNEIEISWYMYITKSWFYSDKGDANFVQTTNSWLCCIFCSTKSWFYGKDNFEIKNDPPLIKPKVITMGQVAITRKQTR